MTNMVSALEKLTNQCQRQTTDQVVGDSCYNKGQKKKEVLKEGKERTHKFHLSRLKEVFMGDCHLNRLEFKQDLDNVMNERKELGIVGVRLTEQEGEPGALWTSAWKEKINKK